MTIRKGKTRLHKPCVKCNAYFEPDTQYSKMCVKCFDEGHSRRKIGAVKANSFRWNKEKDLRRKLYYASKIELQSKGGTT